MGELGRAGTVAEKQIVPLLPKHGPESTLLIVRYSLVNEAHVLQNINKVKAAILVDRILYGALELTVERLDEVAVRRFAGGERLASSRGRLAAGHLTLLRS